MKVFAAQKSALPNSRPIYRIGITKEKDEYGEGGGDGQLKVKP